jgi:hypothetical protein
MNFDLPLKKERKKEKDKEHLMQYLNEMNRYNYNRKKDNKISKNENSIFFLFKIV